MENVASEQLGVEVTESSVDYLLSRLYNDRTNKGLLVEETSRPWSEERELFVNAAKQVDECRYRAERFFNELREWLDARPGSNGRVFEPEIVGAGLTEGLEGLKNALRRAEETLEDADRRQEYRASRMRVSALIAELEDWRLQRSDGYVYWIESFVARKRRRVAMRAAPIDVAPILREKLFNATPSVIATSATLTVGGVKKCERAEEISLDAIALSPDDEPEETRRAFKFFRSRVGLTGAPARSLRGRAARGKRTAIVRGVARIRCRNGRRRFRPLYQRGANETRDRNAQRFYGRAELSVLFAIRRGSAPAYGAQVQGELA